MGELNLVVTTKVNCWPAFQDKSKKQHQYLLPKTRVHMSKERQILDLEYELCKASYITDYSLQGMGWIKKLRKFPRIETE